MTFRRRLVTVLSRSRKFYTRSLSGEFSLRIALFLVRSFGYSLAASRIDRS